MSDPRLTSSVRWRLPRKFYDHYWVLAGACVRGQHCPEIVGPVMYHALANWRFDVTASFRASDDGMPEAV